MNLKNAFYDFFSYKSENSYNFSILENSNSNLKEKNDNFETKDIVKIYSSLSTNIEYIKTRYNLLINSDIVLRKFNITVGKKHYSSFLLYIDGMADSKIMDDFILKPLMISSSNGLLDNSQKRVISETKKNNVTIRKIKKIDLNNYLIQYLLPQNSIKQIKTFDEVSNSVNSRKLCVIC